MTLRVQFGMTIPPSASLDVIYGRSPVYTPLHLTLKFKNVGRPAFRLIYTKCID